MTLVVIFIVSGLIMILLITVKGLAEKRGRPFLVLEMISRGDIRIREFYHRVIHFYSESKEHALFFCQRQWPTQLRYFSNKLRAFLKEKREQYSHSMRDSRLLRKSDGISDFFKSLSKTERGNGEINDVFENDSQNTKEKVE